MSTNTNYEIIKSNSNKGITKIDKSQYTKEELAKYESITSGLTIKDNSVLEFGSELEKKLAEYSDDFLNNIKAFDAGEIGSSINDLLSHINYADPASQGKIKTFLAKIPGVKYLMKTSDQYLSKYDSVSKNIDDITTKMDKSRLDIIRDNVKLSNLMEKNYNFIGELEDHIISGHMKIDELKEELAQLQSEDVLDDIAINDNIELTDRLSKRIHGMELTRVITIQSLPQIKMVQNNNNTMAEKIQLSINSTIPVWKNQIAIAVTLKRQGDIAKIQERIHKTTNDILLSNAENLKTNSIDIARQNESGFVDVDTIKKVNENLISTLNEITKIKNDGQKMRDDVEQELVRLEKQLKDSINNKD